MNETTQLIFTIAASVFDVIITMIYLDTLFENNRKYWISKPIYYLIFISTSVLFWFMRLPINAWIFFMIVSIIEVYFLAYLYESKMIIKLFAAFSLQVFSMLSEVASNSILSFVGKFTDGNITSENIYLYAVMLSKLIKFIMILIVMLIMQKNALRACFKDYLCLIIVPILSIFIIISITIVSKETSANANITNNIAVLGILVINFIVYYLLSNIIKANEIVEKQTKLETQFMYQEKKYEQTSMSFKSISGIIHDTNKHLIYLRECMIQQDYNEAIYYIDTAMNNISNSYKRINSGYLVIDALVSNAYNVADSNKIKFKTDIKIDKSKINIERYDLSVALGNLLDNAIEACVKISNLDDRYIKINIFTTETALVINILNSAVATNMSRQLKSDKPDKIRHGYGLGNVNRIVEKYGGSFNVERKESKFEATAVIPLIDE